MKEKLMEAKQVPFLIEEKLSVFWESLVYARQALSILKSGETKGVFTCERALRKVLGMYPFGVPTSIAGSLDFDCLMAADSSVLHAWVILRPSGEKDARHWKKVIDYLVRASNFIIDVYGEEAERLSVVTRKGERRPNVSTARKNLALAQLEPFRLCQMYKRYTKK